MIRQWSGHRRARRPAGGGGDARTPLLLLVPEAPLDVESEVDVAFVQRRPHVRRGDVLVGVRGVAVGDEDLEVVPADGALEAEGPGKVGVYVVRQIAIGGDDLADYAQRVGHHVREAHRYVGG